MTTRTSSERVKRYEQYGIDKNRYLELKYLARQYERMRRDETKLRNGETDRPERSGNIAWKQPDPTGNAAIYIATRSNADKIRAIEDAAWAAAGQSDALYTGILRSVTAGVPYERMSVPCGRVQFLRMRRAFYVELDRRI